MTHTRPTHGGTTVLCVLSSEFADIELAVDRRGNGDRLALRDLRSERVDYFDPLELEALVWAGRQLLIDQLGPSADRWREGG